MMLKNKNMHAYILNLKSVAITLTSRQIFLKQLPSFWGITDVAIDDCSDDKTSCPDAFPICVVTTDGLPPPSDDPGICCSQAIQAIVDCGGKRS